MKRSLSRSLTALVAAALLLCGALAVAGSKEVTDPAAELRRLEQAKTLDRLFELRQTLTPEEWGALLDTMK